MRRRWTVGDVVAMVLAVIVVLVVVVVSAREQDRARREAGAIVGCVLAAGPRCAVTA